MMQNFTYNEQYLRAFAKLIASETLHQVGLDSGELTAKKAKEVYGRWLTDAIKSGRILPCRSNGKGKFYAVADILALQASDYRRAELY